MKELGPSDKQMLLPALPPPKSELEITCEVIGSKLDRLLALCSAPVITGSTLTRDAKEAAEICGSLRVEFLRLAKLRE